MIENLADKDHLQAARQERDSVMSVPWRRSRAAMAMLLAGAAVLLPSPPAAAQASAAEKVMIVGDSISHGSSGDWTWRYRLWKHLESTGTVVDFVGPRNDLSNIMTEAEGDGDQTYADPAFDRDHGAKWGQPLTVEMNEIDEKVSQYSPNLLLTLLGINDLGIWGHDAGKLEADLRTFIANARTAKADVRMVFGKILPTKRAVDEPDFAAKVSDFNTRLVQVAAELTTPTSPIVVADTASGFVADDHTWDGVHPNGRGELRIAAAFADTMNSAFGLGAAYPRPLPDVPLGPQQAPVASVTATGPGTADLAWTPSLGATQYWVWTKDNVINKEWKKLPIPLTQEYNPWHMTDLLAGNTYYYKVQAAKGDDAGAISNDVTLPVGGPVPAAAGGLTATAGDGKAVLNWTAGQDATGYKVIMRNVTAGQAFQELPYAVDGTTWTAQMLQNGAAYEFKLKSVNGLIDGGVTAAVSVNPTGPAPTAPTNLTVTNGDGNATLTWVSDINATDHEIHVRNVSENEATFTKLPYPVPGEKWTADLLVNGATYEFKLRAMNGLIPGAYSAVVTARPSVPTPSAATNLTATGGNGTATLRWTAGANASAYHVYIRNVTASEAFQKLPYPVEGTSWTADHLINGATYEFRLQSINGLIEGSTSGTVSVVPTTAPPAAPTGLTATAADHEAVLRWTAAANATGYYVHMRNVTAGETFRKLPYPVSGTSWTAETLVNGATYQFKLQSTNGLIEGSTSAAVSVTPTGPAPVAPSGLTAKAGDRKAVLNWNMPANATGVYIHTKNVSAGETSFTKLPYPVHDDSWTATGLVNGATYQYKIQAYNDLIAGGTSTVVSVTPQGPPAPGPETIYATPGNQKVTLRWSGASRATGYDIWIREVTFGKDWRKLPYTISDDTFTAGLLVNGALYEFKVQSKDGLQAGGFSNTVSATPLGPTPQVSNLQWTPRLGEVTLKWSGSSTSTGYYIQMRNVTRGESFRELPYAVSGTSFTAGLIIPGEYYEFRVQAVNGLQRGVTSNTVTGGSTLPPPLSTLTLKPGIFSLKASWQPVSGVDSYTIYYYRSNGNSCSQLSMPGYGQMTELGYVTGTSYNMPYLFEPGCHWLLVAPTLYGVKAPFVQANVRGTVAYKGDNDDSNLYESVLTYIYKEMYNNARSDAASDLESLLNSGNALEVIAGYAMWADLVWPEHVWDHKPAIATYIGAGKDTRDGYGYRYHITGMSYEVYYDIWSNIHYGYVGRRVRFSEWELQTGAAPIGVQDPGDVRSISIGAKLWNTYGWTLTRANVDSAVRANVAGYLNEEKVIPWSFSFVPNV
ncbi:fibronectin type III domain-containing protein [Micromonospora maritima]|uniref:Fibronectin type III domain-containing protein n=1 Tax=Micromonospora maritima TaxID=986711 RepID=A0ABW7ZGZ2_9ACTN